VDDRGPQRRVEGRDGLAGDAVAGSDDDPCGVEKILHRAALGEELGVRDNVDVIAFEEPCGDVTGTHRDRALVDDDRAGQLRMLTDVRERAAQVAVVEAALGGGRGRHADEDEAGAREAEWIARGEGNPFAAEAACEQLGQTGLIEPDAAGLQHRDALVVDVDDLDPVAQLGEARRIDHPDVPGSDDRDSGHSRPLYLLRQA